MTLACLQALALLPAQAQTAAATPEPAVVVVTAARQRMLVADAPASLSVVPQQDIAARGADNVLDAVRGETGMALQGRAMGGRKVHQPARHGQPPHAGAGGRQRIGASDGVIGHSDFQYDWMRSTTSSASRSCAARCRCCTAPRRWAAWST
jgi:outer membrane receptor for ferrienterochelin and colicins